MRIGMPRHLPMADLVKVTTFVVISGFVSALIFSTLAGGSGPGARTYKAVFTDASGVRSGDDIRVAGVKVGRVEGTELLGEGLAEVTFSVEKDTDLTDTSRAYIRFANLIGQRYIALIEGQQPGTQLDEGATIPENRTKPAIDLTLLFNGLQPLLTTFSADEINEFGEQLLHVMQGEGGTIVGLLRNTAILSEQFADRDAVFGRVIDNMNLLLSSTNAHKQQIRELIGGLQTLVHGVAKQRDTIFSSLDAISELVGATSGLVRESRPYITADLRELNGLLDGFVRNRRQFVGALRAGSTVMYVASHVMGYGEMWNLYVCNVKFRGAVVMDYQGSPHSNRCR